jgi:UDP-GlcNAc3NAcA epimerase
MMHSIITIVGARPQFVKAAVLSRLARSERYRGEFSEYLVHTGQHYDENMSGIFFREMSIPEPDLNLEVGSGSHGAMTGTMLTKIEEVLLQKEPELVIVYGDTNSTLAGALAASKLRIPVVHVEAGLRSRDRGMPEEQNRIIADHLSTVLFCPTDTAVQNLLKEGIGREGGMGAHFGQFGAESSLVENVGDIMFDAFIFYRSIAIGRSGRDSILDRLPVRRPFRLLTLHRAENTDDIARLADIAGALQGADDMPLIFPAHPRTRKCLGSAGISFGPHVRLVEPVGYLDMLELEDACEAVITDSGGVQKEAYFAAKPCFTLRDRTEWIETVESGWNRLFGIGDLKGIGQALRAPAPPGVPARLYGDGMAGVKMLETLRNVLG